MKHDQLRGIAHDIAASIADGCSLLVGMYEIDVAEALQTSPDGVITANFLRGTLEPPLPASSLALAVLKVASVLPEFCTKQGVPFSAFSELRARYSVSLEGLRYTVTIVDDDAARQVTITDAGGLSTTNGVSVTVSNADVTPPTVSMTAPPAGATVSGTTVLSMVPGGLPVGWQETGCTCTEGQVKLEPLGTIDSSHRREMRLRHRPPRPLELCLGSTHQQVQVPLPTL
jgi:hypothetical protein